MHTETKYYGIDFEVMLKTFTGLTNRQKLLEGKSTKNEMLT